MAGTGRVVEQELEGVKRSPAQHFDITGGGAVDQVGALCWRRDRGGRLKVLLVTSRETGRWVIPKGWPIAGLTAAEAALHEAWEEAGVRGSADPEPLGSYGYDKVLNRGAGTPALLPCRVSVFAVAVRRQMGAFPEAGQRRLKWRAAAQAAGKVEEPELRALILGFAARAAP
jgi:8-oxo-dGTP pyrophosphatase MutT (NUDIX family)